MIPPLDFLIAVVLIVGPAEIPDDPPCLLESLRAAALSLELLDLRETGYYFVRRCDYRSDLSGIRDRYSDLRDAPPLCDCSRFPGIEECQRQKAFNREYKRWLEDRQRLFPREEWIAEAIADCEQLYRLWDWVDDAQRGYYVYWRRRCLQHILEFVGPNLYYSGCLPAAVPAWAFWRIDG